MLFQLLRCEVALAGDKDHIVVLHRGNPIVFPELPILQFMHGEEAVTDIHVVGEWDTSNDDVLQRLNTKYRDEIVKQVFPGTRPRLPTGDPSIPPCTKPIHVPGPTRPDSPDPILKPLGDLTMPATMPRVVSTYRDEPPPPAAPTGLDALASHAEDETPEDLGLGEVMTRADHPPKPNIPDAASFRARDNVRGQGSTAPRTADHLPDVAGGAVRPLAASRAEGRAHRG